MIFFQTTDVLWTKNIPTVVTDALTDLTGVSVTANGTMSDHGGENATRRGFCYKIGDTGDPTISDSVIYDDGDFSIGAFLEAISSLTAGTKYLLRAYAVNSAGVGYGETVPFITDLVFSDSVSFSDTLNNKNIIKALQESLTFLDDTIKNVVMPDLQDSLILADAIVKNVQLKKSDQLSLSDAITNKNIIKALQDQITLTDSIVKNLLMVLQDSLILADAPAKNILIPNLEDSFSVADAIDSKNVIISKSDTITLSDVLWKNTVHQIQDLFVLRDDFEATLITGVAELFRDMVIAEKIKSVLSQLKVKQILSKIMTREVSSENIRQVNLEPRRRQVMCTPVDEQGTNDLLVFSPKQAWEEYYVAFNFARVITPLTTIQSTVILVYDEAGTEVSETFTDDTKTQITGAKVFVWVRGGTEQTYKITCRIIMSNGEKFEQDATLEVTEV